MQLPLPIQDGSCAKDCPFYVKGGDNTLGCLLKETIPKKNWNNIIQHELSKEFEKEYQMDCEGIFEKCCFANEIWDDSVNNEQITIKEDNEEIMSNNDESMNDTDVKITIHKVQNPYQIKCDVLIYPTNNLLEIKDAALNRMSRNRVQAECDHYLKSNSIKMGHVYPTSNGSAQISAKKIYHAVVAGESLLINDVDISNTIRKSLILADNEEAEIVAILVPDVGQINNLTDKGEYSSYELLANAQLNTLYQYLMNIGVDYIKYILVLTESQIAYDIYVDQFSRTFSED